MNAAVSPPVKSGPRLNKKHTRSKANRLHILVPSLSVYDTGKQPRLMASQWSWRVGAPSQLSMAGAERTQPVSSTLRQLPFDWNWPGSIMEQQDVAPTLVTLPGNVLHDIASHLDGHSLLALLRTSRDLHGSHALKACLLPAVLRQLAALQASVQSMLPAWSEACAIVGQAQAVIAALPHSIKSIGVFFECAHLSQNLWHRRNQEKELRQVIAGLDEAKEAVQHASVVGQPRQALRGVGKNPWHAVVQARQVAIMTLCHNELDGGLLLVWRERILGLPVGDGEVSMRAAVQLVRAGQPQAGDVLLQAVMQRGEAHVVKQRALKALKEAVQAGQEALQAGNGDLHVLQAAVQAAQALLQEQGA